MFSLPVKQVSLNNVGNWVLLQRSVSLKLSDDHSAEIASDLEFVLYT
jgi:hypothetical protein